MNHARGILGGAMFLVVCSAVAALACRDIERPAQPSGPKVTHEQEGPPIVAALTCQLDGTAKTISCATPSSAPEGVSASVIYGSVPGYAQFYPVSLVKDTVAHTWQFTAYVQNLLKQSIGTLNGTTVTGVKVFITDFHATAGTGTASVANADGVGNFTAPNQPYFNYNQIVAAAGYTSNKLWKFNVPNTVTAVSMTILISTDFPAEQSVAVLPPDSSPTTMFQADSNWRGSYMKRVITVAFKDSTSLADRQLAVAYVGGTIVGGVRSLPGFEGLYNVAILGDGSDATLTASMNRLQSLPQIKFASETERASPASLKPYDGASWRKWTLSPDSVAADSNWAPEQINAPLGWGCSVGSVTTQVAIIDHNFESGELSTNTVFGAPIFGIAPDGLHHGSKVASILAARGNDSLGISGVMWRAGLRLEETFVGGPSDQDLLRLVQIEAAQGTKIVNLSWEISDTTRTVADSLRRYRALAADLQLLRPLLANHTLPLLVIAAGNRNANAHFTLFDLLHDSLPSRTLIVSGSNRSGARSHFAYGALVDVYAPGEDVGVEYGAAGALQRVLESGTSYSAPLISGIAGLLLDFDPSLTADSLKQLILRGAVNGRRLVVEPGGTQHYIANAYESLKEAAKRPGAPLCGNRIWGNGSGDQLIAQRGTTTEVLKTTSNRVYSPTVYHGGKQIQFYAGLPHGPVSDPNDPAFTGYQIQCEALTWNTNGTWTLSPPRCDTQDSSVTTLPPLPGTLPGSFFSQFGKSHNGDTALTVDPCPTTPHCYNVQLNFQPLATVHSSDPATDPTAAGGFAIYSPYGDRGIVVISNGAAYTSDNTTYSSLVHSEAYSVRFSDGRVTALPAWTMNGQGILAMAISEDGKSVVAHVGHVIGQLVPGNYCAIEYRAYDGSQLSPAVAPITNVDACNLSDLRIPRSPGGIAPRKVAMGSATLPPSTQTP